MLKLSVRAIYERSLQFQTSKVFKIKKVTLSSNMTSCKLYLLQESGERECLFIAVIT